MIREVSHVCTLIIIAEKNKNAMHENVLKALHFAFCIVLGIIV